MTQVAPASSPSPAAPPRRPAWLGPLVAGLCCGVTYGISQRLLSLNVGELIRFGQGFDVQVFPGTTLDSLRLRFGDAASELRGDLELQQLQQQPEPPATETVEPASDAEPLPPDLPAAPEAGAYDPAAAPRDASEPTPPAAAPPPPQPTPAPPAAAPRP